MSVLANKRIVSKAEFVNTANQIYVETLSFLTRMSARYSRLLAEPVAKLAGEIVDHSEKANSIFPMSTLGNRPDLFPTSEYPNASQREDYLDYDVPTEALEDETFAAMLKEAEKYLGYPYV